jgi:cobalt-zinc-cadmium resistance protein CzcA
MIDQFVGICLHRRVAVILLTLLIGAFGVYAWKTLSVEAYPDLGDVAAQVTTQMPGLAAEEVEQLITVPLERQINGTPGLLLTRSTSTFGLSLITVLFRDGYEDYWARQRLLERINQAVLPAGASPQSAGVVGDSAVDGDSGHPVGAGRRRRDQLRRLHHRVPARSGSGPAAAIRARHRRRDQCH